jgi:transposase-like protein
MTSEAVSPRKRDNEPGWQLSPEQAKTVISDAAGEVVVDVPRDRDGRNDVLGLWMGAGGEGAKFWQHYPPELRERAVPMVAETLRTWAFQGRGRRAAERNAEVAGRDCGEGPRV